MKTECSCACIILIINSCRSVVSHVHVLIYVHNRFFSMIDIENAKICFLPAFRFQTSEPLVGAVLEKEAKCKALLEKGK